MRENSRGFGSPGHSPTLHWHDGGTCLGHPTLEECAANAISHGWTGKVLEIDDAYQDGTKAKCYSLIAGYYEQHGKRGKYVAEVKLIAVPIVE